jgi:hypothetical protein
MTAFEICYCSFILCREIVVLNIKVIAILGIELERIEGIVELHSLPGYAKGQHDVAVPI